MPTGIQAETVAIFVPLIFVVVERLSSTARESVQLEDVPQQFPLLLPALGRGGTADANWKGSLLPRLGQLNYVHVTNMALLTGSLIAVAGVDSGALRNIVGILVIALWMLIPLLEIGFYRAIREEIQKPPCSLYFHFVSVFILIIFLVNPIEIVPITPGKFLETFDLFAPRLSPILSHKGQILGLGIFFTVWAVSVYGFLHLLEREVKEVDTDSYPGES